MWCFMEYCIKMTTQLEREFFEWAEIDKQTIWETKSAGWSTIKIPKVEVYPPITSDIILGLITILCKFNHKFECCYLLCGTDTQLLKDNILKDCIELGDNIKPQVQSLFK